MDYSISLYHAWLHNDCNTVYDKITYDNHLIATRIELKYIEKYIYNTCSNKKNPILRKRTIKSIYCIGTFIVHMRADMVSV